MEATVRFGASKLTECLLELGFTMLPTDWCFMLFENDCHVIEVHKTPQENMFRLLWRHSMWDMDMDGIKSLSTYLGCLVHDADRVRQFYDHIQECESC